MEKSEARLKREVRRLRRENEYLRHRLSALGDGKRRRGAAQIEAEQRKNLAVLRSRSYIGYLILSLEMSRSFRLFDRTAFAVRRVFFASKLWRILRVFALAVGAGTGALAFVGALLIALPAFLLFTLFAMLCGLLSHRKWNRFFGKRLDGLRCYVVFSPANRRKNGYFDRMVRELSESGAVLIVSRSYLDCGFSGASAVSENVYQIHTSYYFSLLRRMDGISSARVVKII